MARREARRGEVGLVLYHRVCQRRCGNGWFCAEKAYSNIRLAHGVRKFTPASPRCRPPAGTLVGPEPGLTTGASFCRRWAARAGKRCPP